MFSTYKICGGILFGGVKYAHKTNPSIIKNFEAPMKVPNTTLTIDDNDDKDSIEFVPSAKDERETKNAIAMRYDTKGLRKTDEEEQKDDIVVDSVSDKFTGMAKSVLNSVKHSIATVGSDSYKKRFDYTRHKKAPYLPIVAPDFSYVMDIMFLGSLQVYNSDNNMLITKSINNAQNNCGYNCILIFIDTTSRKIWLYPQKSKNSEETYKNFLLFYRAVNGKIARLLSDNDTAFAKIKKNNRSFNYAQIVAEDNHTTLSRVDRAIRTVRKIILDYATLPGNPYNPADWLGIIPVIMQDYNNRPHQSLWLYNTKKKGVHENKEHKKVYYTPNQVWINQKLRSRIRLRNYMKYADNYNDGTRYDQLRKAKYVNVKIKKGGYTKGMNENFSNVAYPKGAKFGNSYMVNGKLTTYRNLYPAQKPSDKPVKPVLTNAQKQKSKMLTNYLNRVKAMTANSQVLPPQDKLYHKDGFSKGKSATKHKENADLRKDRDNFFKHSNTKFETKTVGKYNLRGAPPQKKRKL